MPTMSQDLHSILDWFLRDLHMRGTSHEQHSVIGESRTTAAVRELDNALRATSHFNLNGNSLTWDHHPHPLLRSSISAQAGTFSPCLSQVIALHSLVCAHASWLDPMSRVVASLKACISSYLLLLLIGLPDGPWS